MLDEPTQAYEKAQVVFPWEAGDVLMLDNMLVAHGREPIARERTVLVAMAELHDNAE